MGKPCSGRPLFGDASAALGQRWTPFFGRLLRAQVHEVHDHSEEHFRHRFVGGAQTLRNTICSAGSGLATSSPSTTCVAGSGLATPIQGLFFVGQKEAFAHRHSTLHDDPDEKRQGGVQERAQLGFAQLRFGKISAFSDAILRVLFPVVPESDPSDMKGFAGPREMDPKVYVILTCVVSTPARVRAVCHFRLGRNH